jgi:hypothetical protein
MHQNGRQEQLELAYYLERLRADHPELADEFVGFHGVDDILQWMSCRVVGRADIDIIGQDEFHYDFLVRAGPQGEWLAFGLT